MWPVICLMSLPGILILNLLGLNLKKKSWSWWLILLACPYSGKILALWDNGHVSSQLLFWIFLKGIEPNSKCSGAQMYCETASFSSGIFRTCGDRTNPLLTERRNSFSTEDSAPLGVNLLKPLGRPPWRRWGARVCLLFIMWIQGTTEIDSFKDCQLCWAGGCVPWYLLLRGEHSLSSCLDCGSQWALGSQCVLSHSDVSESLQPHWL